MVRAILDGRKTQTRRVVSDRHLHWIDVASQLGECYPLECGIDHANSQSYYRNLCPFGDIGDRLWVRETWQGPLVDYENANKFYKAPEPFQTIKNCVYKADGGPNPKYFDADDNLRYGWKSSAQMPSWASRILLEITGVRVERLQDISGEDAHAEGFDGDGLSWSPSAYGQFADMWMSIYGAESWNGNPWCWVIEFKQIQE